MDTVMCIHAYSRVRAQKCLFWYFSSPTMTFMDLPRRPSFPFSLPWTLELTSLSPVGLQLRRFIRK